MLEGWRGRVGEAYGQDGLSHDVIIAELIAYSRHGTKMLHMLGSNLEISINPRILHQSVDHQWQHKLIHVLLVPSTPCV